jgi:hypothetical protein
MLREVSRVGNVRIAAAHQLVELQGGEECVR